MRRAAVAVYIRAVWRIADDVGFCAEGIKDAFGEHPG